MFTAVESWLVAYSTLAYPITAFYQAVIVTATITVAVSLFACQTRYDFTTYAWHLGLTLALLAMILLSLLNVFIFHSEWWDTAIAVVLVVIFTFFIIHDTQLVIGGNHSHAFSEDDYVLAAICLYLDIINLFLQLLSIFGNRRN